MSPEPDSTQVCRLCLSNSTPFIDVFDSSQPTSSVTLQEKINTCLPVKIASDDKLSTKLCESCLGSVNSFYDFWILAESSQQNLELSGATRETSPADGYFGETTYQERGSPKLSTIVKPKNFRSSSTLASQDFETAAKKSVHFKKNICRDCGVHRNDLNLKTSSSSQHSCCVCQQAVFPKGSHANEKRKYECSVCEYSNYSLSNFKIHMMKHNGGHLVECHHCGKGFYSKSTCREHIMMKHSQRISTNHCSYCNNSYHSKAYLRQHMKIHSPNYKKDNYQCEICGKTYWSRKGVNRHKMRDHQGQIYQCEICDKEIKSLESLKNHRKIHRGEKSFVCATCGKAFGSRNGLTVHERVHTGFKPFKCRDCDKSFSQSSSLKIHIRYHRGERPYRCEHCNKRYVTMTLLKKHEKIHKSRLPLE